MSCPLLSTHVICPFHQTHPHSVITGHLGLISFLNLAFWGISCSHSLFIFMSINCLAPSNPKQTACVSLSCFFANCLLTLSPSYPPKPHHNPTYERQTYTRTNASTNWLPLSPGCPRLPSVHLREDTQCDPSPAKGFIKFRCATTFETTCFYPLPSGSTMK